MTWLVVILGLALLVFLHELGHFAVARLVGMKPRAFYIGFPPAVVTVRRNGIEYGIGAVPLGGYVRTPGMQRPAAGDFQTLMSSALEEDQALAAPAEAVHSSLGANDFALFNLLPLLPLDGGNILFSIIEGLRRRPVPQAVYQRFSVAGVAVILLVTVIAFSNDIGATPH